MERAQSTLFPEYLDDWVDDNDPVRVIDVFADTLHLAELGFEKVEPAETGRPAYHPSRLLKLAIYGYLNGAQSSRRLGREASRNVELMWLLSRLVPDYRALADFRKDNGSDPQDVCALCRALPEDVHACDGEGCD
jgi:transposase